MRVLLTMIKLAISSREKELNDIWLPKVFRSVFCPSGLSRQEAQDSGVSVRSALSLPSDVWEISMTKDMSGPCGYCHFLIRNMTSGVVTEASACENLV